MCTLSHKREPESSEQKLDFPLMVLLVNYNKYLTSVVKFATQSFSHRWCHIIAFLIFFVHLHMMNVFYRVSTVGYGNLTPTTSAGRWFSIFYIYAGILLVFSVLGDVAALLVTVLRMGYRYKLKTRKKKLELVVRHSLNSLMWFVVLFAVVLFGGVVFSLAEDWPLEQAIYFSTVTGR